MSIVSSKAPNPEKGARYLGQLDQALCNGSWSEIQELARKTDKHAPERRCLTLAARSEAQVASAVHRPTSASSTATTSIHGLGELKAKLQEAIAAEKKYPEDVYAAKVCLAEIHWLREDSEGALETLPQSLASSTGESHVTALGWLEVCEVKAVFIKALLLEANGSEDEARQIYLSAAGRAPGSRTSELRRWTERLLARGCMFAHRRTALQSLRRLSESLRCFLGWSSFWQRTSSPLAGSSATTSHLDISRRQVWKAYYDLLSTILTYGLMYNLTPNSTSDLLVAPSDDMPEPVYTSAKVQQRNGLKQVEATYESLLLNETHFPKASETNEEVERWVAQAVANWKILSGPDWSDSELGEGGKERVGRGVLDILYRAATKTFHSTAILRQLFTVHAALGEFELAMHALNSYVEIVGKGKARAEKTGKHELGFDSDDTALLTAAEAVRVLCRYGDRVQAEKAIDVGKIIERWLGQQRPTSKDGLKTTKSNADDNPVEEARPFSQPTESLLQAGTLAASYRAIGISQAHWARLTYETDSRSGLQADAIRNIQQAQSYDQDSLETAHALGLTHAETRDVSTAIQVLKRAIAASHSSDDEDGEDAESSAYRRERQLLPLWHLLALCLTAKDDYEQAAKMCQAAYDQFGEPTVLFGESGDRISSETEKHAPRSTTGLVDQMEGFEKESVLQLKMSQLSLIELMTGVEAALDASHELLSLYARLFGDPGMTKSTPKPPNTANSAAPSRTGGTIRSFIGSIRPKSARHSVEKDSVRNSPKSARATTGQHQTSNGRALDAPIAITVTNEDGQPVEKSDHHHHLPFKLRGHQGDWREHGNLKSTNSTESLQRNYGQTASAHQTSLTSVGPEAAQTPNASQVAPDMSSDSPLNLAQAPQKDQPLWQDVPLTVQHITSSSVPDTRLSTAQDRQQKVGLIVEIWLFIAGMYLRAKLLDDASGAIDEAYKLVESFQSEVSAELSSARRFFEKGWAGGKSVDHLWADVLSAKGDLASARALPFEAMPHYDQALAYFPDHAEGIIGLSNHLMDMYEKKIPTEEPRPLLQSATIVPSPSFNVAPKPPSATGANVTTAPQGSNASTKRTSRGERTPAEINRLASRDRAYMLLSTLTRLGSGWDNSEAWLTLARSHELSKQIGKAKQALWWVVELEDNKPMRPWQEVSAGGLTL